MNAKEKLMGKLDGKVAAITGAGLAILGLRELPEYAEGAPEGAPSVDPSRV